MVDVITPLIQLTQQDPGGNNNTWGTILNTSLGFVESAIAGSTSISTTGGTTALTDTQARAKILFITGTLVSNAIIQVAARTKTWTIVNLTTGAFSVTIKTAAGTGVVIPQGLSSDVYCDGTNVALRAPWASGATGVALLGAANAAAALNTLGVSSFVQGLLSSANAGAFETGLGISSFIQTLLDDADAATARTTLGVSNTVIPTGVIIPFGGTTAPSGYNLCDGTPLSRSGESGLFAVIGTAYGVGDGSTTFNVPDFRGEFMRGNDNGRGVDSGRTLGSAQAQAIQNHNHALNGANSYFLLRTAGGSVGLTSGTGATDTRSATDNSTGTNETRPRNVSVNYIIKK